MAMINIGTVHEFQFYFVLVFTLNCAVTISDQSILNSIGFQKELIPFSSFRAIPDECNHQYRVFITLYTKIGIGSKSMDTIASFIGQESDSNSHSIIPEKIYDLRHARLIFRCWY